jgi:hypothetical protein
MEELNIIKDYSLCSCQIQEDNWEYNGTAQLFINFKKSDNPGGKYSYILTEFGIQ